MGRALRPTRQVSPGEVQPGDVVMLRWPHASNTRWMLVDEVPTPSVWVGRWAYGQDVNELAAHVAVSDTYTVKHERDARSDQIRLESLRSNA